MTAPKRNILFFACGLIVGALPPSIAWRMQTLSVDTFDAELIITPEVSSLGKERGEVTKVEFKSYIIKHGNRILHGPSLRWYPATEDTDIFIYTNGSLNTVRSRSLRRD